VLPPTAAACRLAHTLASLKYPVTIARIVELSHGFTQQKIPLVLIDHWHPVTSDLGLVNAPIDVCSNAFISWHDSIGQRYTRRHASSLERCLELLPPLSNEKRRIAFLPTAAKNWTALLQSGISGSDPFPVTSMLAARLLKVSGMRVCVSPGGKEDPAVIWEIYSSPEQEGDSLGFRRTIAVAKDGDRWAFDQSGEPFAFERLDRYTLARKRDRFTREMLIAYLAEFGLAPFSDSFYTASEVTPAVVLERIGRWTNPPPEFTLEQVLAGIPWRRT